MRGKKAPSSSVVIGLNSGSSTPLSSHSPRKSSNGGSRCAAGLTSCGGSNWYESTCMANSESEVLMEAPDQGIGGLRLQFGVRGEKKNRGQSQLPQDQQRASKTSARFVGCHRWINSATGSKAYRKIVSESAR